MDGILGKASAAVNAAMVAVFAGAMLAGSLFVSYASSLLIALSFAALMCAYCGEAREGRRTAGLCAAVFGAMYALCNAQVYFTQMTTVRMGGLTQQALELLDFQQFGMLFQWDMLGYALMSVSTFFAGLSVCPANRRDRWLKGLLLIHGVFAVGCFVVPLLGLFRPSMEGGAWVGTALLEFWCAYFLPVGILSFLHFSQGNGQKRLDKQGDGPL